MSVLSVRTNLERGFYISTARIKLIKPNTKRPKRKTKKAAAEEQPAEPATQNKTTGGFLWSRDDEQLVDYDEVEEPATFSPAEEENYREGDEYPAHTNGPEDEIDNTDDFPPIRQRVQTA